MNYKKEERKFINLSSISKYLICIICQEVFFSPLRLTCGHTFCESCIKNWEKTSKGKCPICRKNYVKKYSSIDLIANNIINECLVLCIFKECPWKGQLSELNNHINNCCFNPQIMPKNIREALGISNAKTDFSDNDNNEQNDNKLNYNLDVSLKARLYQSNPELVSRVYGKNNNNNNDIIPKDICDAVIDFGLSDTFNLIFKEDEKDKMINKKRERDDNINNDNN